jgi:RHS repeat-associated protein
VMSDRSGARSYSFNELGLARREVRSIVAPVTDIERGDGRSETYLPEIAFYEAENAYTAFGDPVQERFSEGAPMNPAKACVTAGVNTCLSRFTIGRKYAPDGGVAQLLVNGKLSISAAQDALGRPAVRWTANGIATGYRYDSEDLRLNQMSTLTGAQQPVQRNGYQYDGGGNIVAYANNSSMLEQYSSGFVFKYDAVNRLTNFAATVRKDEKKLTSEGAYTYDPGHRFKTRSLRIAGDPGQVLQRRWDYRYRTDPQTGPLHAPSRIDFSVGESTRRTWFDYDDVGRMTRICTNNADNEPRVCSVEKPDNDQRPELLSNRAMTWDAEGRLTRVRGVVDSSVPLNAELMHEDYVYDAGGNRALKIGRRPRTDDLSQGAQESATIYMTPYYARPYDRRGSVQISLGTLPAVSLAAPADPSEEPRATFLYSDLPVGSMTAAVTAFGEPTQANATVIARREYSPYGLELTVDELAQTGREGVAPISVFHGKELDRLTSFSSFGARYYSRDLGIWLRADPMLTGALTRSSIGYKLLASSDFATYSYGRNNPATRSDSTGLRAWTEQETVAMMKTAYREATAGPIAGILNMANNSLGYGDVGKYDFGYTANEYDTWTYHGMQMNADQMANFMGGFQAAAYDRELSQRLPVAQRVAEAAGTSYHILAYIGIPVSKATDDPWNRTGMPDIKRGESVGAAGEPYSMADVAKGASYLLRLLQPPRSCENVSLQCTTTSAMDPERSRMSPMKAHGSPEWGLP